MFAPVHSVRHTVAIDCQLSLTNTLMAHGHRAHLILKKTFYSPDRTLLAKAFCTYVGRSALRSGLHVLIVRKKQNSISSAILL